MHNVVLSESQAGMTVLVSGRDELTMIRHGNRNNLGVPVLGEYWVGTIRD